jgi:pyridoxine 4-dehydrogenase
MTQNNSTYLQLRPLGRGMLTGRYRSPEDIPADDVRKRSPQFQGDNFKINLEIVDKLVSPVVILHFLLIPVRAPVGEKGENQADASTLEVMQTAIAEKKGVSSGQLALAWLLQKSDKASPPTPVLAHPTLKLSFSYPHRTPAQIIPIPGSGSAKRTVENIQSVNVHLSSEELDEIEGILSKFKPAGDRYANNGHGLLWGKGRED